MRGWYKVLLGTLLVFAFALPAYGDTWVYVDARGVFNFTNAPSGPQYQYYMPDTSSWKNARFSGFDAIGGARRKAYDDIIRDAARRHQVDVALVKAVIRAESDFVSRAVSPKGALGLMQLMPATAHMHNVWRVFEPSQNLEGGVTHLRYLLDRYGGNLRLALAAYNAGEKAVDAHGGVPPYPETWEYLARVMRFRNSYLREQ